MGLWDRDFSFARSDPISVKGEKKRKREKMGKNENPENPKNEKMKNENENENEKDLQDLISENIAEKSEKEKTILFSGNDGKRRFAISGSKLDRIAEKCDLSFRNKNGENLNYFAVKENETPILFHKLWDRIAENGFIFKRDPKDLNK